MGILMSVLYIAALVAYIDMRGYNMRMRNLLHTGFVAIYLT